MDLILTGGFNVYPAEVERVVVLDLARPLPRARSSSNCRPHLAVYKVPRSVRFVPDLPKTSTGKVMRRELRALDQHLHSPPPPKA